MTERRICVYTAITGNYDNLKDIMKEDGIDYFCFTNNKSITSSTWNVKYIDNDGLDNITLARKQKIVLNDYIQNNYDIAIWVDGATSIRGSIKDFLENECELNNYDMTVFRHSVRDKVFDEAVSIVKFRKEDISKVQKTIQFLEKNNYPDDQGLTETTVLVRKTNNKKVNETMALWFDLLSKFTIRDQLTFDYSVYKVKPNIKYLNYNVFDNPYFGWVSHNKLFDFNKCRVYFGEYKNIFDNNILDISNTGESVIEYEFTVNNDCDFIELWSGQQEHTMITNFKISGCNNYSTNCVFNINEQMLTGNDPLVIRMNKCFVKGEIIKISFYLKQLTIDDYRELVITNNKIFTDIITNQTQQIKGLENNSFIKRIKKRGK